MEALQLPTHICVKVGTDIAHGSTLGSQEVTASSIDVTKRGPSGVTHKGVFEDRNPLEWLMSC